jgi:hypothetical protein
VVLASSGERSARQIRDAIERTRGPRLPLRLLADNIRRLRELGLIEGRWGAIIPGQPGRPRYYRLTAGIEAHADDA